MASKTFKRIGFGQVEPNHISGNVDGSIYAQLPVDKAVMGDVIENGRFAKYDYTSGKVTTSEDSPQPWLMIYNEIKLYDEREQGLKDFAMVADNYTDGEIVPRLIEINVGDLFTTNTFAKANKTNKGEISTISFDVADVSSYPTFYINENGFLDLSGDVNGPQFVIAKIYTMPDGQDGIKLQRVK